MARIACAWVPELAVTAVVRARPELRDAPLAITDGRAAHSVVIAASAAARATGVRGGMTAAHARVVCDGVVVMPYAAAAVHAAGATLADVAATLGPRVELSDDGTVYLDCEGSAALCASEAELATILAARARRHGLTAWVGIAGSKVAARLAARESGGVRVVPRAEEHAFLAPLAVELLDPDPETRATLASWGVTRIGDLARLPAGEVAHRLGPAGALLARRARGEDDELLRCRATPATIIEAITLEYEIDRLEPLLFLLRRLLDQLASRLALHGLACATLDVTLERERGAAYPRHVVPAAPSADAKVLLTLVRAHLEREPPDDAVTGLHIVAATARIRATQLDLFRPNGPSAVVLAATIARLAALCGADRVGRPVALDSHRPDATAVADFTDPATAHHSARNNAMPAHTCRAIADSARASTCIATDSDGVPADARVALRAFRPPVVLEVFESAGRLDYVRGRGFGGRVVHLAGPWRLRGEWWTTDPYDREYYDVELTDGALYRIFHDRRTRQWLADGMYD